MSIPMLAYGPTSQNQRVVSYEVPSEEHSRLYSSDDLPSGQEMDALIWAAYRQIFNEQQITASNRQLALESQLRSGQITVRDFIRGLALSDTFRRWIYDCNSNYRVVQLCVQRLLGRQVYSQRETIAWSIVLATQGLPQFTVQLVKQSGQLQLQLSPLQLLYQCRRSEEFSPFAEFDNRARQDCRQMSFADTGRPED